jgi:phosphatidylglycerophosphate synthase
MSAAGADSITVASLRSSLPEFVCLPRICWQSFDRNFFWLYFPAHRSFLQIGFRAVRNGEQKGGSMKLQANARGGTVLALLALALITIGQFMWAQNLGSAPASNVAVQGQTAAQPEGAFLNFINWVGNVIAPVGAGGAVLGAVVSWLTGRGFGRWLFAAAALLAISGVTRLIEFWITNGTGGVA